jgi:hypothetical protein
MKKLFLSGIAALLLATGTAQATESYFVQCGHKLVNVYGHHGPLTFTEIIKGQQGRELSSRMFRFHGADLYFHGRKCFCIPPQWEGFETPCPLEKTNAPTASLNGVCRQSISDSWIGN